MGLDVVYNLINIKTFLKMVNPGLFCVGDAFLCPRLPYPNFNINSKNNL